MSSTSALESNEDLDNVPLVRMEDVQPRERSSEVYSNDEEILETCIVDNTEYEECVIDDDDSNIGSMVSIQSEEVVECEENEAAELIIPEVLEPVSAVRNKTPNSNIVCLKPIRPDSWPTLEILPGGVIKHADKDDITNLYPNVVDRDAVEDIGEMMYACAKCSQSFKYLFCLVKHVKWHEEEAKKVRVDSELTALKLRGKQQYICLHSSKRKTLTKNKKRKLPKKS